MYMYIAFSLQSTVVAISTNYLNTTDTAVCPQREFRPYGFCVLLQTNALWLPKKN